MLCNKIKTSAVLCARDTNEVATRFVPLWRNAGSTPTIDAVHRLNTMVLHDGEELEDDFDFPDFGPAGKTLIGPHGETPMRAFDLTIEKMNAILEGRSRAYAWGWIEYRDIYPDTPLHRSEFCFEIKVSADAATAN